MKFTSVSLLAYVIERIRQNDESDLKTAFRMLNHIEISGKEIFEFIEALRNMGRYDLAAMAKSTLSPEALEDCDNKTTSTLDDDLWSDYD